MKTNTCFGFDRFINIVTTTIPVGLQARVAEELQKKKTQSTGLVFFWKRVYVSTVTEIQTKNIVPYICKMPSLSLSC